HSRRGVTRDDDHLHTLRHEERGVVPRIRDDGSSRFCPVRHPRSVPEIYYVFSREPRRYLPDDGKPAYARIEYAYRRFVAVVCHGLSLMARPAGLEEFLYRALYGIDPDKGNRIVSGLESVKVYAGEDAFFKPELPRLVYPHVGVGYASHLSREPYLSEGR